MNNFDCRVAYKRKRKFTKTTLFSICYFGLIAEIKCSKSILLTYFECLLLKKEKF